MRFFLLHRTYHYTDVPIRGSGVGRGLERLVYRHLVQTAVIRSPHIWQARDPFIIPKILQVHPNQTRLDTMQVWGSLAALHIIHLGLSPSPISPFLILATVGGTCAFDNLSEACIRKLDWQAADVLSPWFALTASDRISSDARDVVCQLLIHYLSVEVCIRHSQLLAEPLLSIWVSLVI